MLSQIGTDKFFEWWGYYLLEPFGEEWGQVARLGMEITGAMTGKYPKRESFMPVVIPPEPPTPAQMFGRFIQAPKQ